MPSRPERYGIDVETPEAMRELARKLAPALRVGDLVGLEGELGAGKTTLARAILAEKGWTGPVRSPTFNLIQIYPVDPPILHADLYRVPSESGLDLDEFLETHVCLVEWPDRLQGLQTYQPRWRIRIQFHGSGRRVDVLAPDGRPELDLPKMEAQNES